MTSPTTTGHRKLQPPRNYLARSEQRRLLLLVISLGLVLVIMGEAAKPQNWAWMWGGAAGPEGVPADRPPRDYDTSLPPPPAKRELPPGTFIAPLEKEQPAEPLEGGPQWFPGVEPEHLQAVRDHAPLRHAESKAWFNLLEVLRDSDQQTLRRASIDPVSFVQVYEQPRRYRGKLITVRGVAKRAFDVGVGPNELGLESYWQVWVFPEGGPMSPFVVYSLNLPEGFPTSRSQQGEEIVNIHEPVEVTGFFYKNWPYSTGTKILSSPLVLARQVDWKRPVVTEPTPVDTSWLPLIVASTAALGLVLAALVYFSSRLRLSTTAKTGDSLPEDSQRVLDETEPPDVGEVMRSLVEEPQVEGRGQ